jgi:ABC-type multidrug transport system ATPase subunit
MEADADSAHVEALLKNSVPEVQLLTDVGAEMTFQLPSEASAQFAPMLRALDSQMNALGVENYGLSQVTMEEVFLKVGQSAAAAEAGGAGGAVVTANDNAAGAGGVVPTAITDMSPIEVFGRHFAALLVKRVHHGRRDYCAIFCSAVLPALMLSGALALMQSSSEEVQPDLVLDTSQFHAYSSLPPMPYNRSAGPWPAHLHWDNSHVTPQPHRLNLPPDEFFGHKYLQGMPCQCNGDVHESSTGVTTCGGGVDDGVVFDGRSYCCNGGWSCNSNRADAPIEPEKILSMMQLLYEQGLAAGPGRLDAVQFGAALLPSAQGRAVTIIHNTSATHAVPTFTNAISNALRRQGTGKIIVRSQPFDRTAKEQDVRDFLFYILISIIIMIAFAFVPAAVVTFPVLESEAKHNSRHQQYISGVSIPAYWLSSYIWDMGCYLILLMLCFIALDYYDVKAFTELDCQDSQLLPLFATPRLADRTELVTWAGECYALMQLGEQCPPTPWPSTCAQLKENPQIGCSKDLHDIPCHPLSDYPSSIQDMVDKVQCPPEGTTMDKVCPKTCGTCGAGPTRAVLLLFLGYGMAIIPATYMFSFLFKQHTSGQLFTLLANILTGLVMELTHYILHTIGTMAKVDSIKKWDDRLLPFFRFSPAFCLGDGIFNVATKPINDFMATQEDPPRVVGPSLFTWEVVGADLTALYLQGVIYLLLTMLIDYLRNFPELRNKIGLGDSQIPESAGPEYDADPDVAAEEQRVNSRPIPTGSPDDDVIDIRALRKVYGRKQKAKVAVRSLTLGLPRGECFGFLGINGAGKTSTLNILTGAQLPTSGNAWLGGKNILTEQKDVRRLIGYCPQHDALLDRLTVREHLQLFGRIKGVKADKLEAFVQEMMTNLDLKNHEKKLASRLSGGNKRKLSVGIALIGSPALVFLDEPSTGVDPGARRFMWDIIARLTTTRKECTVVLTTHNMEEAEALCSRVGIMVGGRLRCLGSNQRLKAQHGQGYQLEIKLAMPSDGECAQMAASQQLPPLMHDISEVGALCARLGDGARAALIQEGVEEGNLIWTALMQTSQVTDTQFAQWWLAESNARALNAALMTSFPQGVQMIERHDRSFRYRVQMENTTLATVFEKIENEVQAQVNLEEYGLSQSSLEQIFNQFAAQQEEERGQVRGMQQLQHQQPMGGNVMPANAASIGGGGTIYAVAQVATVRDGLSTSCNPVGQLVPGTQVCCSVSLIPFEC